jgi:hypothetical protein
MRRTLRNLQKESTVTKGAKIALGCGLAVVGIGAGVVVVLVAGAFWVKGKAETYVSNAAAKADEIARYTTQANRNPFTPPADGVLQEAQLVMFLDVRKQIYSVYERHKPEFDSLAERTKHKKDLSFSETVEAGSLLAGLGADVRLVQMKALAAQGMSEGEYRYIQQAVYRSAWAGEFEKEAGSQPSEYIEKAVTTEKDTLQGGKGALGDDQVKRAQDVLDAVGQQARGLEVPRPNIELFRRYEAEIKKYAMTGLAAIGL